LGTPSQASSRAVTKTSDYGHRPFGGYGKRVTEPGEIVPTIKRAIAQTQAGTPAPLEFLTAQEITFSVFK